MAKKKNKIMPFFKYLTIVMVVVTLITLGLVKFIDILPLEYFYVFVGLLVLISIVNASLILTKKNSKKRVIGSLLTILYIIILILGIVYLLNTIGFLKRLGFSNYKTENYSVLVLKETGIDDLNDLKGKMVGSLEFSTDGLKKAKEKLDKKVEVNLETYKDASLLKIAFLNSKVDSILIENSVLSILNEEDNFSYKYKVIYEFSVDVETEDITKNVDITKDAFNIYISGIDTYGAISSVARSDVNMILSVNPKTKKILITSIPRDYYLKLATKGEYDKFTHSGIYGVEESVKTLEEFLDIKINYYIKVNFTSMINVIDALGGVNVYSEYSFVSIDNYEYNKGYNEVKGEKALSFVRERQAFVNGDRIRVMNQAAMVRAMIDKAISPAIITNYNSLLKSLSDAFITNISKESLTSFIKKQIQEETVWDIENVRMDGTDSYEYTYSYKWNKLYVMIPDNESVNNTKAKLKEVLN